MSNDTPPKPKRSFRVIFKIIKFVVAMVLTFCISFAVTFTLKTDNPADYFDSVAEEFSIDEEPVKSRGASQIKTLFDELNNQPLSAMRNENTSPQSPIPTSPQSPIPTSPQSPVPTSPQSPVPTSPQSLVPTSPQSLVPTSPQSLVPSPYQDPGFFGALNRMTSIKPAVDEKLKTLPHYVTIDKMPHFLLQAVVSVEDTRFYKHKGFDLIGIARAVLVNVEAGEIQEGASTITQQTVKNLFLTSDQTFTRKAEELILSMNMEKDFSKDKILEIYLNVIYFGSNFYGIYDASQGYFGKEPADLTIAECAMLAGVPNAPSLYSPYVDFRLAKQRQLVVIDAMEKLGIITRLEAENARIEEIILAH